MANIKVSLELDNQGYITGIKNAETATENLGKTAAKAGKQGADGIGQMGNSMDMLSTVTTKANQLIAAVIGTFAAVGASSLKMADEIVDSAEALGLSAARVYQLNVALEASGGQFGSASALFKGFSQSLGDVEKGSKETIDALYKLGLSKNQIETLSDDQLFQAVVNGLGKMEAGFERNRIAMQLVGRAGDGIDWTKMAQGTSQAVSPEMEARLQAAADAVGAMETAFRNFQLVALEVLAPVIEAIASMNINADDVRKTIQILGAVLAAAFAASVVGQIVRIIALIKELGGVIRAAGAAQAFLVGLSGAGLAVVAASAAAAATAYYAIGEAMDNAVKKAKSSGAPTPPGGTPPPGTPVRRIGTPKGEASQAEAKAKREAEAYDRQISQAVALGAAIDAQTKSLSAKYKTELDNIGLTQDEIRLNNELAALLEKQGADVAKINGLDKLSAEDKAKYVAEINAKYAEQKKTLLESLGIIFKTNYEEKKALALIQDQIADRQEELRIQYALADLENQRLVALGLRTQREGAAISERLKLDGDYKSKKEALEKQLSSAIEQTERDRINTELGNLEESYNNNKTIAQKTLEIDEERRQSLKAGYQSVIDGLKESITPFQVAVDATGAVFGNLESAISEFARTGKLNFGDFARSIIADLIAITLRTIILRTVLSAFGGMFGGGGAAAGTQMTLNTTGGLPVTRMAAAGGSIRANQSYITGEKGPELFLPNTSGTMIPNNKLGALGGSTVVNYNIQAVDASSFRDLVARDPEFIYSVTQVGARRMPR